MPIYTPHGLKIRYSSEFVFSLLNRFSHYVSPFIVLSHAEHIENIPSSLSVVGAFICLFSPIIQSDFWWIYLFGFMILGRILGIFLMFSSLVMDGLVFWILVKVSMIHICLNSWCSPIPVISMVILSTAHFHHGFTGVFISLVAICVSIIVSVIIERFYVKYRSIGRKLNLLMSAQESCCGQNIKLGDQQIKHMGELIVQDHTFSELCFDAAYAHFAKTYEVDQDMQLTDSDNEMVHGVYNWEVCKEEYEDEIKRDSTHL